MVIDGQAAQRRFFDLIFTGFSEEEKLAVGEGIRKIAVNAREALKEVVQSVTCGTLIGFICGFVGAGGYVVPGVLCPVYVYLGAGGRKACKQSQSNCIKPGHGYRFVHSGYLYYSGKLFVMKNGWARNISAPFS